MKKQTQTKLKTHYCYEKASNPASGLYSHFYIL
jgi:hypothetical protein